MMSQLWRYLSLLIVILLPAMIYDGANLTTDDKWFYRDTVWKLTLREPDRNDTSPMMSRCEAARNLDTPRLYDLTSDPAATTPVDPEQHSEVTSKMLKALQDHRQSLEPVPSQFALHRLLWRPWNQPCCNFPKCACEDEKFSGMFED